jgi:hypothetical protein
MIQQFEQAVGQLRDALVRRRLGQSWTNSRARKTLSSLYTLYGMRCKRLGEHPDEVLKEYMGKR